MELWGAEYQESNAILCHPEDIPRLTEMAARERCPFSVVGDVTGTGRVVLSESTEEQLTREFRQEISSCQKNNSRLKTDFFSFVEFVEMAAIPFLFSCVIST